MRTVLSQLKVYLGIMDMEGLAGAMWSLWNSVFFFLLPLPRPLFFPRLLFIFFVTPLLYVGSYPPLFPHVW
jgi:hypothetical protein